MREFIDFMIAPLPRKYAFGHESIDLLLVCVGLALLYGYFSWKIRKA